MNNEVYQPIETEIGFLSGRDAIYLDEVIYNGFDLALAGTINGALVTGVDERWLHYRIVFSEALAFRSVELDSWYHLYSPKVGKKTSFAEILNSRWKAELGGKITPDYKHFYFSTYDDVFDIVCMDFALEISKAESE